MYPDFCVMVKVYCIVCVILKVSRQCLANQNVQHSDCLPYYSHAFTDGPYSSCLLYRSYTFTYQVLCSTQMPVESLAHLQIMDSIQTACHTIHTFTDHVQYSIQSACHTTLMHVLYSSQTTCHTTRIYRLCTVQHSNCHTTHTFADHVHAAAVWQLPFSPLKQFTVIFPPFYSFFFWFVASVNKLPTRRVCLGPWQWHPSDTSNVLVSNFILSGLQSIPV